MSNNNLDKKQMAAIESSCIQHSTKRERSTPEELSLNPEQSAAYALAERILTNEQLAFFAPLPSVVSLSHVADEISKLNSRGTSIRGRGIMSFDISNDINAGNYFSIIATTPRSRTPGPRPPGMEVPEGAAYHRADHNNNENTHHINALNITESYPYPYYTTTQSEIVSLFTPTHGFIELNRALEKLDGLEKEECNLLLKTPLVRKLTELVMEGGNEINDTGVYLDSSDAVNKLEVLGKAVPRRVCQHPFKKNDIVWVCRTCQADETCVLCHACFSQSNHDGHDVAFYHAQAGGCCDCGDPDAWDPSGFCPYHGPNAIPATEEPTSNGNILDPSLVQRVRGVVPACTDWLVRKVTSNAEIAYKRANPSKPKSVNEKGKLRKVKSAELGIDMNGVSTSTNDNTTNELHDNANSPFSRSYLRSTQHSVSMPIEMMEVDQSTNEDEAIYDLNESDSVDDISIDHDESNDPYLIEGHPLFSPSSGILHVESGPSVTSEVLMDHLDLVFSPEAASFTRRRGVDLVIENSNSSKLGGDFDERKTSSSIKQHELHKNKVAKELGLAGSAGQGLYLVLHADDIHTTQELQEALREFLGNISYCTDDLLNRFVKALRQFGQLVIWGTIEILSEVGQTQAQLWMDGDEVASTRIGALLGERARRLSRRGLFCSILTRNELILEQRAVAVLQWLSCLARSCDPLCVTVAESILPNRHLVPLLRADFKMSARVTKAWYSLLLTLLAVPTFKSHLAAAYCDTYRNVTAKYARGMGVLERSGYTLSVQFLNRVTYVIDLVQKRDLLGKLGKSLLETFRVASQNKGLTTRLNPNHFVLTHRRYAPCVSDLKCVLNVKGMPRVIACKGGTFLRDWIDALALAQFMDPQVWRHWSQEHVEDESRGWVGAFNASISLGSLFERLLGWEDDEESPIKDFNSPLSHDLMSCVELTVFILTRGIDRWQRAEVRSYDSTPYNSMIEPYKRSPASLPFSSVAVKHGTALAMRQLPVSQATAFSFHLPLHRFVSGCLRELCLRKNCDDGGFADLMRRLKLYVDEHHKDELFRGLMEFPILVLSRAAQVRANLWRRNGHGLSDQVLNYGEPPFCRNMRDADLLLAQFGTLGRTLHQSTSKQECSAGMAFLSNLLLHRLGIFDFAGMENAPHKDKVKYLHEISLGLYPRERDSSKTETLENPLPWTYTPVREYAASTFLVEEFLQFMIVFISELPPVVPMNREEHTKQAQFRLFREVIHRLASGPKTHSELLEVHHVLSHWDNVLLSEQGKLVNPDDATGASLATVLADVANRKTSRGKMEPDKWELRKAAWEYYDPAFFHISQRCHQSAAEARPKPVPDPSEPFGWKARSYAPEPRLAHPFFSRLRRDATADITVLALTYRVLRMHCRNDGHKDTPNLKKKEKSETALARCIHLITLGMYAWKDARKEDVNWRLNGGGSPGSLFFHRSDDIGAPTVDCWISSFLLADPTLLFDTESYDQDENALLMLQRLSMDGGVPDVFIAQDPALRAGAAWLCEFAMSKCPKARSILTVASAATQETFVDTKHQSEIERRKNMAKEAAMAKMKAQALKFASLMDVDLGESEEEASTEGNDVICNRNHPLRKFSFGSTHSSLSSTVAREPDSGSPLTELLIDGSEDVANVPSRLLQRRPKCIICNYEDSSERERGDNGDGEGQRKKSKRRTENALGFVGYAQASTVLKGGGGPPPDPDSSVSPVREFVGTHVALCGHAVHSECCESYLATVSHREDRAIGKRDEFRCPLCQRLSNCLVPFIDVGIDWIHSPSCHPVIETNVDINSKQHDGIPNEMQISTVSQNLTLRNYLESTHWWVTRHNDNVVWDGQSAFIDKGVVLEDGNETDSSKKPSRRFRPLKKKDLYAAWNAMMRTPRQSIVRRSVRRSSSISSSPAKEDPPGAYSTGEDSTGETVVWKRFIDQIADISYRADSKRLGDSHLHDLFGEFRHYVVEKYAYNMAHQTSGTETQDWPSCLLTDPIPETRRQELSREKLLSKLLLSIQAFTYSCCSEAFEARRAYRRSLLSSNKAVKGGHDVTIESVLSRFGISGVICEGRLVVLPIPKAEEDNGPSPFDGRIGKLRYLGLCIMAASAAVAADLVQLTLPFPLSVDDTEHDGMDIDHTGRAPITYPLLFGHVLTHTVAAMSATCGRARARTDSLDVVWPVPFSCHGCFASQIYNENKIDSVTDDCDGFLKLGLLARTLQILLGCLKVECSCVNKKSFINFLKVHCVTSDGLSTAELSWVKCCVKLLELSFSKVEPQQSDDSRTKISIEHFHDACNTAALGACSFLCEAGAIYQVLVPGCTSRLHLCLEKSEDISTNKCSIHQTLKQLLDLFGFETFDEMLESDLVQLVVSNWYLTAYRHSRTASHGSELQCKLFRTQGFRVSDWPSAGYFDKLDEKVYQVDNSKETSGKLTRSEQQPHDDILVTNMHIDSIQCASGITATTGTFPEVCANFLTLSSKKCVPLVGGYTPDMLKFKANSRPRVQVMPTSYTDLYAELCSLMPECEQIAVCLICGEVLNAGGKGECTKHSYKCGAGAGMFFLLQECSGLIMHKSKAAYIHSPYVDSHGETPQYRGRPLNLDVDRYELLREVWFTHGVRQKVVAERGSSRQVIIPDFY